MCHRKEKSSCKDSRREDTDNRREDSRREDTDNRREEADTAPHRDSPLMDNRPNTADPWDRRRAWGWAQRVVARPR